MQSQKPAADMVATSIFSIQSDDDSGHLLLVVVVVVIVVVAVAVVYAISLFHRSTDFNCDLNKEVMLLWLHPSFPYSLR